MFSKNKKRQLDYRELEKKYNSLELNYEILIEKTSSELYKAIIDGDFELKYENDSLREQNKDLQIFLVIDAISEFLDQYLCFLNFYINKICNLKNH